MRRCLILQGGGLRGAFAAGACFALADLKISEFELAFAVSASVPTLAYFLAGQCRESREVWENYLSTAKLIRYLNLFLGLKKEYRRRPLVDLYYLVYRVFRDRFPLKMERLMSSATKAFFVAMDAGTYQPHYFPPDPENIYNVMQACMALPVAVPGRILINGRPYMDGGLVDPLPVRKAIEMGSDHLLVVMTIPRQKESSEPAAFERFIAKRYLRDNPRLLDLCLENGHPFDESLDLLEQLEHDTPEKIAVIRPETWPPAGRITRDRSKITSTLQMGYDKVMDNRENIMRVLAS